MSSCEICLRWFHFNCVGVTHSDPCVESEDVPYYCPSCDVNVGNIALGRGIYSSNLQVRRAKKAKRQSAAKEQKAAVARAAQQQAEQTVTPVMSATTTPGQSGGESSGQHSGADSGGEQQVSTINRKLFCTML